MRAARRKRREVEVVSFAMESEGEVLKLKGPKERNT